MSPPDDELSEEGVCIKSPTVFDSSNFDAETQFILKSLGSRYGATIVHGTNIESNNSTLNRLQDIERALGGNGPQRAGQTVTVDGKTERLYPVLANTEKDSTNIGMRLIRETLRDKKLMDDFLFLLVKSEEAATYGEDATTGLGDGHVWMEVLEDT